jgi:hypothetical protein
MAVGGTVSVAVLLLGLALVTNPRAAGAARGVVADLFDGGVHVEQAEGVRTQWRLSLPPGHWHEHEPEKESGAERAFVWPEPDAATYVNVQALPPGSVVDLEVAADSMVAELKKSMKQFEEHERHVFRTDQGDAVSLRTTMVQDGVTLHGWVVLHTGADELGVVVAAARDDAQEVQDELLEVASSLELGAAGVEGGALAPENEAAAGEDAGADEGGEEPAEQ